MSTMTGNRYSILYILGRGRSGSTVVDAVLGNLGATFGTGELVEGLHRRYPNGICSCGAALAECPVWGAVVREAEASLELPREEWARALATQMHLKSFPKTLIYGRASKWSMNLRSINDALYAAVSKATGCQHVVDSSKEMTRAYFILKHFPEAKGLHLVRNPHGFISSYYQRILKGGDFRLVRFQLGGAIRRYPLMKFPGLAILALSWLIGNLYAEFLKMLFRERVLFLRYDDFCIDSVGQIALIAKHMGQSFDELESKMSSGEELITGHKAAGNEWTSQKATFAFDASVNRKHRLPWLAYWITSVICFPLILKYKFPFKWEKE